MFKIKIALSAALIAAATSAAMANPVHYKAAGMNAPRWLEQLDTRRYEWNAAIHSTAAAVSCPPLEGYPDCRS
jgi:hypothetical protein